MNVKKNLKMKQNFFELKEKCIPLSQKNGISMRERILLNLMVSYLFKLQYSSKVKLHFIFVMEYIFAISDWYESYFKES